jgi:potassium efflux system protein
MIAIAGFRRVSGTTGRLFIPLLLIVLAGFAGASHAADNPLHATRERLDAIRAIFDQTEAALIRPSQRDDDLVSLRNKVEPLRAELRAKTDEIEPQHADTESRLKELGPAPAAGAPPENPKVATQRAELTALLGEIDGVLRQAKLLLLRGDQIVDRIDAARRALSTQRLFARSGSVLSPALWMEAAKGLPSELQGLTTLVSDWKGAAEERGGPGAIAGTLIAIVALIFGILALRRAILRRIDRGRESPPPSTERHPRAAYIAFCRALVDAATAPLAAFASIEVLLAFELLPARVEEIATGLLAAIVLLSVGRALTHAVLAPDAPARRLMLLDDGTATRLYYLIAGAIIAVALAVFLHVIHRVLAADVPVRLATSALMALIVAFFLARLLLANRPPEDDGKDEGLPSWARLIGWAAVAAILATLATGHINLAAFIAARIVDAVIVIGGLVLLLALVDSLFDQSMSAEHGRRRNLAATFGVKPA